MVAASLAEALAGQPLGKTRSALVLARKLPHRRAMTELLAIARSRAPRAERINALTIAGRLAAPADGRAFMRFLDSADVHVQAIASDGIERARYQPALPRLAAIVNQDGDAAIHAAFAMAALASPRGVSGLVGYMHSSDPRIREAACRAVWLLYEGNRIAPALEACTRDRDKRAAAMAKRTVRTIEKRRAIKY